MTPQRALELLRQGNERFVRGQAAERDLKQQVADTSEGQWPFAAILGCMDSRTPAELVFDLGIGDVFNVRVAGNCVNTDVTGSLEYACGVVGSRLIVVLGHSRCGAVKGACDGVELGNLTALLARIQPAVDAVAAEHPDLPCADADFIRQAIEYNVIHSIEELRGESKVLSDLENEGTIAIIGAIYDVESGVVEFLPPLP